MCCTLSYPVREKKPGQRKGFVPADREIHLEVPLPRTRLSSGLFGLGFKPVIAVIGPDEQ